jgi:hypothetical protein
MATLIALSRDYQLDRTFWGANSVHSRVLRTSGCINSRPSILPTLKGLLAGSDQILKRAAGDFRGMRLSEPLFHTTLLLNTTDKFKSKTKDTLDFVFFCKKFLIGSDRNDPTPSQPRPIQSQWHLCMYGMRQSRISREISLISRYFSAT